MRFLVRMLLLPFRLVLAALAVGFRAGMLVARIPARASARVGRAIGPRAILALVVGVAIGLLFAPGPGRELRRRVRERLTSPVPAEDATLPVAPVEAREE